MFCAPAAAGQGSVVRQPILLDLVAVGFEQHLGAALDHAVAFAGLLVQDLAGSGDLEALFSARFGLQLGHLALLCPPGRCATWARRRLCSQLSCAHNEFELFRRHGSPSAGPRKGGVMAETAAKDNRPELGRSADPAGSMGLEPASLTPHRGAKTMIIWRPSNRASCSTLAYLEVSSRTRSRSLAPSSW